MTLFTALIIRSRIAILILTLLTTICSGVLLRSLETDDDMMQFFPREDPDVALFHRVNKQFGGLNVAIIGLESENIFTHDSIKKIRILTRRLAAVDGVYDVLSFTEIPNPQPSAEGLRVTPLVMDRIPVKPQELQALKKKVLSNPNAVGNLVASNGKAAMVLCFLGGNRPRLHIARDLKKTAFSNWPEDSLYLAGAPFLRAYVVGGTYDDLVRLTPLVILVVLLVTFAIFRTPLGVFLSIGATGVAIVWVMGATAISTDGMNIFGSSLPTILIAIGGAYGMHVLTGYYNGSAATVPARIEEMMRTVGPPVLASGVTTAIGFLSFLAMDIAPLREFGIQAAAGIGAAVGLSLFVVPAVLSFQKSPPVPLRGILTTIPLKGITTFSSGNRKIVYIVSFALTALCAMGIHRIAPDATMETFFRKDSPPDKANRFLERNFGGSSYLQVYFEGDLRSPFVLYQLQKIVEFTRTLDEVEQVSAITDSLVMMNEAMGGHADIPLNNRRAGSLFPFLEGTAAIDQMISPNKDASLVQIRLKNISAARVSQVIDVIRRFIADEIPAAVKAVQVGPFANPQKALSAYSSPAQRDENGVVIKAAWQTPVQQLLSDRRKEAYRKQLREEVVNRIVRLAKIHQNHVVEEGERLALRDLLNSTTSADGMPGNTDTNAAVKKVIDEHLVRNFAFLDTSEGTSKEGTDNVGNAAMHSEWKNRSGLVFARLKQVAHRFVTNAQMTDILKETLPLTCQRDPEGMFLTANAMTQSLATLRARVRALHWQREVMKIITVTTPTNKFKTALLGALTTMDIPVFGFEDTGPDATPVMAMVTGTPVINIALCESTIANQIKSIAIATIFILFTMTIVFRSLTAAIKGMLPAFLMLIVSVGLMGAFSVPIDMSTSMIATIALGISVDYALHFLWRRKIRNESLESTTTEVGPSIVANALQVSAGFAVLCISNMIPMKRFGVLVAVTMALAAAATFVLLPALMSSSKKMK